MATEWLLVHSPLLGPASWAGVADELRASGADVLVPDLRPALTGPGDYARRQAERAAAESPEGALLLAGHSGAGPLLPAVAGALATRGKKVTAAVFVDAGLPHPGLSRRSTLPAALAAHLEQLTRGGRLPPWPQWWAPDELAQLLPDSDARAALLGDCPPLPAALFDEPLPSGIELVGAYVQLSAPYAEAAHQAHELGWPVTRLDADHLTPLTRPVDVAAAMVAVADDASPVKNAARRHVHRFNESVRTGDWGAFAARFTQDAAMRFTNVPLGPYLGREAIAHAYAEQPPDDTMTVRGIDEDGPDAARVTFHWDAGGGGTMNLRWAGQLVEELTITFG